MAKPPARAKALAFLQCQECPSCSDTGRGWIALISDDEEETDVDACVVTYCPRCAEREFGSVTKRGKEDLAT